MRGHRIDDDVVQLHVGIARRHHAARIEKQAVRSPQHIGLVHQRNAPPARARELESALGDARAGLARDLADGDRDIRRDQHVAVARRHVAVGVEALGVLAHDHEVEGADALRGVAEGARRPDIGEQIELFAEIGRRIDPALLRRRVVEGRDGAEDDAIRRARARDHVVRQRGAVGLQCVQPDRVMLDRDLEIELALRRAEDFQRGEGDLRTDAVAR